jgi:pimeloyl-ACP methyl ester carboxylesterase
MKNRESFTRPGSHIESLSDGDIAPIVAIGGLTTIKDLWPWYAKLLNRDETTDLSAKYRFIAPAKRGIAPPDVLEARLLERLEKTHQRLGGRRMFVVGHSLGGRLATGAALKRPDLICGVATLGGVHAGYQENAPAYLLRKVLGDPKETVYIRHDSPHIQEHLEEMASEWPEGIPLHVISTPLDLLVTPPLGHGLKLPHGEPEERMVVHPNRVLAGAMHLAADVVRLARGRTHNIQPLHSEYLTEHLNLPRNPDIIDYIDESRRFASPSTNDLQPELPLAA